MKPEKKTDCTDLQLVIHLAIAVTMGAIIGSSLVETSVELEGTILQKSAEKVRIFENLDKLMKEAVAGFSEAATEYRQLAGNGFQMSCVQLNNYFIESSGNELPITFTEAFVYKPQLFISVNGFLYSPSSSESSQVEELNFVVTEVDTKGFRFLIESSDPEFDKTLFERIDVCYYAMIRQTIGRNE